MFVSGPSLLFGWASSLFVGGHGWLLVVWQVYNVLAPIPHMWYGCLLICCSGWTMVCGRHAACQQRGKGQVYHGCTHRFDSAHRCCPSLVFWQPTISQHPHSLIWVHGSSLVLLQGYKELHNKYVGLISKHEGCKCSPPTGLLVTTMCQCLNKLWSFEMTYKEMLLAVVEFQQSILDIHTWIDYVDIY